MSASSSTAGGSPSRWRRPAASSMAQEIDHLHQYVMWLIIVIFVGVFGFMFYACFAHRKSRGHPAEQFHENITVELLWTIIPALILIVIAWPVTKVVIAQKDTSSPDLTIKATGYQWKWGYDYLKGEGEGISFVSMLATPREQIDAGAQKDENYLLEVDRELVVPIDKKWDPKELVAHGEKLYSATCVACHQANGRGAPPAFPPLAGSKVVNGPKEGHMDIVLNGKAGTAMAPFGKQLSDTDIAAVISYERSSWGNKSGIVQPAEVRARHK